MHVITLLLRRWVGADQESGVVNRMANILQMTFPNTFHKRKVFYLPQITLKLAFKGPINNKSGFVQIMAWHSGDKLLPELMIIMFTNQTLTHLPLDKMATIWPTMFSEKFFILVKISLKFVPKGPIDNISALVQIMAWRQCRPGLLMHIFSTRGRWVNQVSAGSSGLFFSQCVNIGASWNEPPHFAHLAAYHYYKQVWFALK